MPTTRQWEIQNLNFFLDASTLSPPPPPTPHYLKGQNILRVIKAKII